MSSYGQQKYKNPWRPIWTGKVSDAGYQYERWEKVKKEDQDLVQRLQQQSGSQVPDDATSVIRDGYKYWFNATSKFGDHGPQVTRRKQLDESYDNVERKSYQGQDYTVKTPAESYIPPQQQQQQSQQQESTVLEVVGKRLENIERMLTDICLALGKDPFQKASEINTPDDHGNEVSGSNFASGPGTLTGIQGSINAAPEATAEDEAAIDNEDLQPGKGLTEEEERILRS